MSRAVSDEGRPRRPSFVSGGLHGWVEREARAHVLPFGVAASLALLPVVVVLAIGSFLAIPATHAATYLLLMENGAVELATFAAFFAAAVVAFAFAARLLRGAAPGLERGAASRVGPDISRLVPGVYAALGALALVAAMEEIAWGQTLFGFATPAGLRTLNDQRETTIHNLHGLQNLNPLLLVAFGLLACLAVGTARVPRWRAVAAPGLLLPCAVTIAGTGAACIAVEAFRFDETLEVLIGMLPEVVELLAGVFLLLWVTLNARVASAPATAAAEGPVGADRARPR